RSEVQIFPGPPVSGRQKTDDRGRKIDVCPPSSVLRSLIGAIAQLGERLLCKQEVVGSIPSGSTSRIDARPKRNIVPRAARTSGFGRQASARALSDIVKRGSIRKSRRGASRGRSTSKTLLDRTRPRVDLEASWSFCQCCPEDGRRRA